ncbi:MAG: hypothetical protein AUG49_01360 [Catenulispora sp. 13_1_20CM_3_70_7]|nr:MAG: hypothetical protein AUG49_01360 [Catenulispora sp. 13_1_20CM_3_70_7]
MDSAIASRFPLICRAKPLGLPLSERIAALIESAIDPAGADLHDQVARASGVINVASLIASDAGMRDLAWDMCWRHYNIYAAAEHFEPGTATMAMQPMVNIPRLLIRDGQGELAHQVLTGLYRAAQRKGCAEIGGRVIDVAAVIRTPEDHKAVCSDLWMALLSDGTRALAQAGRWTQAADAVARYKGVGDRLWDGRQVTVLSLLEQGRFAEAAATVESSVIGDASEKAVAAILAAFCAQEARTASTVRLDTALGEALALIELDEPPTIMFRTQLALTALALGDAVGTHRLTPRIQSGIIEAAGTDAYAARAVIALLGSDAKCLQHVVDAGGLGAGKMPPDLMTRMMTSVAAAETRLAVLLGAPVNLPQIEESARSVRFRRK